MDFRTRLIEARTYAKLSQAALARRLGIKPQAIQYLEDAKNNARGSKHTPAIAFECDVNAHWLQTGTGAMLAKEHQAAQDQAEYRALANDAAQVAIAWSRLSPQSQAIFRDLIFMHATIEKRYPWLKRGRPKSESYDGYERRVEENMEALVTLKAQQAKR